MTCWGASPTNYSPVMPPASNPVIPTNYNPVIPTKYYVIPTKYYVIPTAVEGSPAIGSKLLSLGTSPPKEL